MQLIVIENSSENAIKILIQIRTFKSYVGESIEPGG